MLKSHAPSKKSKIIEVDNTPPPNTIEYADTVLAEINRLRHNYYVCLKDHYLQKARCRDLRCHGTRPSRTGITASCDSADCSKKEINAREAYSDYCNYLHDLAQDTDTVIQQAITYRQEKA